MNKKIKRTIALAVMLSALSSVVPANSFNLLNNNVYAATYGISSLQVNDGSSSKSLQLYSSSSCDSSDKTTFSPSQSSYYVRTSSNGVNVDFDADSGYYAKVKRGSSGDYDSNDRIHIADGDTMTLRVYVYDKSTDKQVSSYSISVKQTSSKSSSYHNYNDNDDNDDDDIYLDNIKLSDGDISFSRSKSTYTVNVPASVSEIKVTAEPEDEDEDTVKINGSTVDEDDNYKKTVALSNGKNEITIRVYDTDNNLRIYTLYVYRGSSTSNNTSSGEIDNSQDSIYLNDLIFDSNSAGASLNFNPKVTTYNINVNSNCDNVILRATPEYDDNKVSINGENVEYKYAKRIYLSQGKNVISIKVDNSNEYNRSDDDYKNRTYTLNVYRGISGNTSNSNSSSTTTTNNSTAKNQWVSINGRWQFNDYAGQPIKNQWHYDNNYQKWYYLDSEGFMKTGWLQAGPVWYYFNYDGSMATGWILDGVKYYHLASNGVMDHDTTIDRYVLGSDGAWIV